MVALVYAFCWITGNGDAFWGLLRLDVPLTDAIVMVIGLGCVVLAFVGSRWG
jgi:hypothetical protein